jgi:DNA-directed RNA polymerase sigma subunit (sigma70/sigma32)
MTMSARKDGLPKNMHGVRSYAEIAKRLGLSQMRIKQIEARAFRRIKNHPIMQQLALDCGWLPEGNG